MTTTTENRKVIAEEEDNYVFEHDDDDDGEEDTDFETASRGSSSGDPQTTSRHSLGGQGSNASSLAIGARESAQVNKLRVIVVAVLLVAAAIVAAIMYWLTTRAEHAEFETAYDGVAGKVIESFEEIVTEKLSAVSSLAVSATAYARSHSVTWPFVTMNDFHDRAKSALTLSDALVVEFVPLVYDEDRADWEAYTVQNMGWFYDYESEFSFPAASSLEHVIHKYDFTKTPLEFVVDEDPGPYAPIWTSSPPLGIVANFNLLTFPMIARSLKNVYDYGKMTLGGLITFAPGSIDATDPTTKYYAILRTVKEGRVVPYDGDPLSYLAYPIYDSFDPETRKVVASIFATVQWSSYLQGVVPPHSEAVTVVLENPCDGAHTYTVDNEKVVYSGSGDLHDRHYSNMERRTTLDALKEYFRDDYSTGVDELGCPYNIRVYPTRAMEDASSTSIPLLMTLFVGIIFVFAAVVFCIYDRMVERRQSLVLNTATQSTAIVSSFFPEAVRDRLLQAPAPNASFVSPSNRIKSFLAGGSGEGGKDGTSQDAEKPIADLFPFTTVLFADIAGFTAWSSTREPAQVFVLLQTVYQSFDILANKHKVFKVETIGDSYVAATGLPHEQPLHAVHMARFAKDCLAKFSSLTKELEVRLGPDTADLAMRFGIHSGPVTAGVLRGERARFQLFGDTVNTAARMESTGKRNRIQVSHTTATELTRRGKKHWLTAREDAVHAKGKGVLETYWLTVRTRQSASMKKNPAPAIVADRREHTSFLKQNRLVDWCVELLADHIRRIVARRQALNLGQISKTSSPLQYFAPADQTCLDQVQETLALPVYSAEEAALIAKIDHRKIELTTDVMDQLRQFVSIIAGAYRPNEFHNFEHACHVTMSVDKLLKRIETPNLDHGATQRALHEYTHGLTSDPLMLLAIVMSALIHDVDHRGCSNGQLAVEDKALAAKYQNKSIAEQNSLDIAWNILMSDDLESLRRTMFTDKNDLMRFRQVIVNIVLATDIFDKELNDLRKKRWTKAFGGSNSGNNVQSKAEESVDPNLRATIVIEHIIQASDVAHTMQHWHIYRKYNERLFREMSAAFGQGRMAKDPATFWYQGELGFFDNYVIPLARKLKECNVFGVSSDECLNFAEQNRAEWQMRGQEVVAELIERMTTSTTDEAGKSADESQNVLVEVETEGSGSSSADEAFPEKN